MAVTAYCLEPEKIKPIGYLSCICVLICGNFPIFNILAAIMYLDNVYLVFPQNQKSDIEFKFMDFKETGIFLGISTFSFQSGASMFTGIYILLILS